MFSSNVNISDQIDSNDEIIQKKNVSIFNQLRNDGQKKEENRIKERKASLLTYIMNINIVIIYHYI